GLCYAALVALSAPADAGSSPPQGPTFCDQAPEGCIPQAGPISSPAEGISGSTQRQIEQRLQRLRCEGSDDPACAGIGGAAADSVSYEGLGVFVSAGYQYKDKTGTDFELGFQSDSVGPTIGADYRIGNAGVVGAAFDYRHTFGDYDDGYGDFDTDLFTLLVYGSYYPTDQSFIDAAVGFGYKQFDTKHLDPTGGAETVSGNTDGFDFTADLTGGYDFSFGALTVGPRIGLHYKRTELDSFTETGVGAITAYDDQVDDSLTGTVGVQATYAISTSFGVVVPNVNAEYVREFLDDRETYTATQFGDTFTYRGDQPDRNHFNVGGGVVVVLPDGVVPFISYEAELANYLQDTHTVTAGVRLEY
ncbi:MAG: autotransporter outer membrane beta-barrel domain-containing protein, partial [Vicinamibacterales bacterium]